MKYDPRTHARRSIRLKGYDYSSEGMYHVVMRTKNGVCVFEDVQDNEMKLSPVGEIAERCWMEIPEHFNKVSLDIFQIMPNHIYGIVVIAGKNVSNRDIPCKDVQLNVHTSKALSKNVHTRETSKILSSNVHTKETQRRMSCISPHRGTLSVIMRTYKAAVTTACHQQAFQKYAWHSRFYEHIIRDGKDLDRIRQYILENPMNWERDDNFPGNIRMDPKLGDINGFSPLD